MYVSIKSSQNFYMQSRMADSTENATPPKSTKWRTSNSSVHIQIKSKSQFEFVLRDTDGFEFLRVLHLSFGNKWNMTSCLQLVKFHLCLGFGLGLYHWVRGGVATISRLLKIIGLFCRISSLS